MFHSGLIVLQGLLIDTETQFDVSFRSIYRQRSTFLPIFETTVAEKPTNLDRWSGETQF
jgi:hypothetical protein